MNAEKRMVVFTDLDGTLLDHETYSFAAANDALDLLARQGIPLVLCSSKTRAEIEMLQLDLHLRHPFISENGGALFVPKGYFRFPLQNSRPIAGYEVMEFGTPYPQLVEVLHRVAGELGIPVVGFSDMSIEEVAKECNLSLFEARLAKLREYDEPFRILDPDPAARSRFFQALHRAGEFRCTSGGRYYHLMGLSDKGMAIRALTALFVQAWGGVLTVGLGDSVNDLPLLQEVDIPVIVQNPSAGASSRLLRKVPIARLTATPSPHGWNQAILEVVGRNAMAAR